MAGHGSTPFADAPSTQGSSHRVYSDGTPAGLFGGRWARFGEGVPVNDTITEALRSEGAHFRPDSLEDRFRVESELGRRIGARGETGIRVIVSETGRVITAFPVRRIGPVGE